MARLINDSGILGDTMTVTAKTVNDVSFDKMIEAIHIIQEQMGIAGTSAEEGSKTIQGSWNALKASWSNLVTALASPETDLSEYINNVVDTAVAMGENMLPAIEQSLVGIGELIEKVLPVVMDKIPEILNNDLPKLLESASNMITTIVQGITQNIPQIAKAAIQIINTLTGSIIKNLPEIIKAAMELIVELGKGIVEALPELIPAIVECIATITDALTNPDMLSNIWQAALELIIELVEGLVENVDELIDAAFEIVENLVEFILKPENIAKLIECMLRVQLALAEGLIKAIPEVIKGVAQLIEKIGRTFYETDWSDFGWNIVQGVWDGLKKSWNDLTQWWGNAWNGLVDSAKSWLGIHSPSKVFAQIGGYMAEGLGEGWQDEFSDVKDNIESGLDFNAGDVSANANGTGAYSNGISGIGAGNNNSFYFYFNIDNVNGGNREDLEENAEMLMQIFTEKMSRMGAVFR